MNKGKRTKEIKKRRKEGRMDKEENTGDEHELTDLRVARSKIPGDLAQGY